MKANEVVFQELLNGKIQYRVPLFQRTYSWKEDNWQQLWDDLLEIYALPEPRSHFIGAVVTLPIPDNPEQPAKYMLIDGQQRLTTLFILLAAIRDLARDRGEHQLADQITEECLINKYAPTPEGYEKLKPTQQDEQPFKAVIAGQDSPVSSNVYLARRFFEDAIRQGSLDGEQISLDKLKLCITSYLNLVSIRLDQGDSPHRIFESLNNTGMALTASDLVRNHIFMRLTSEAEQKQAYSQYWFPMQQQMESDSGNSALTDFFWRFLMKDGELPRYDEVYEGMRAHIDAKAAMSSMIQALEELNRYSGHYMRLWQPSSYEPCTPIRKQLERLNQWEVAVAYPFMLTTMQKRQECVLSDEQVLEVLNMVESYVVRRIVCGVPTNRLRRVFGRMAGQVQESNYVGSCRAYLAENEWPSDSTFHAMFRTARMYSSSRLSRTRLILTSLERSYQHHEPIEITDAITIEHIMPQSLSQDWREELGPEADSVHERLLHTRYRWRIVVACLSNSGSAECLMP